MFAALPLAPQIAFVLLAGLIVGAAIPLAIGWACLLPEERPPFEIDNPRRRTPAPAVSIYGSEPEPRKLDLVGIVLLVLLTVAFGVQFPGIPRTAALNSLPDHVPQASEWFEIALPSLSLVACVVAIVYGAWRRSFLRTPLILAGTAILLLWVVGPWLYGELTAL